MKHPLVGKRIEIPVHYDMWMRGACFGEVRSYHPGSEGHSAYVKVKLDHPQARKQLKIWALDWDYCKILD